MPYLIDGYSYKVMSRDELFPYIQDHQAAIFAENQHLDSLYALSEAERNALDALGKRLTERYRLGFGIFQGETFVGWHLGQQTLAGTFEMARTGIV